MAQCPNGTMNYTVRPGDTLWLIAQRFHTTIYSIASTNPGMDINNLYIGQTICIRPEFGLYPPSHSEPNREMERRREDRAGEDFRDYIRMLWEEHSIWTRSAINSIALGSPDEQLVTERLLRNPKDFEAALEPFYGAEAAKTFSDLLTDHLTIAAKIVKASKAGNQEEAAAAEKDWYANADQLAAFLGSINPYWSEEEWRNMLYEHLELVKAEAVDILTGDYASGISIFDEVEKQALNMADMMAYGIIRQFPRKLM